MTELIASSYVEDAYAQPFKWPKYRALWRWLWIPWPGHIHAVPKCTNVAILTMQAWIHDEDPCRRLVFAKVQKTYCYVLVLWKQPVVPSPGMRNSWFQSGVEPRGWLGDPMYCPAAHAAEKNMCANGWRDQSFRWIFSRCIASDCYRTVLLAGLDDVLGLHRLVIPLQVFHIRCNRVGVPQRRLLRYKPHVDSYLRIQVQHICSLPYTEDSMILV